MTDKTELQAEDGTWKIVRTGTNLELIGPKWDSLSDKDRATITAFLEGLKTLEARQLQDWLMMTSAKH